MPVINKPNFFTLNGKPLKSKCTGSISTICYQSPLEEITSLFEDYRESATPSKAHTLIKALNETVTAKAARAKAAYTLAKQYKLLLPTGWFVATACLIFFTTIFLFNSNLVTKSASPKYSNFSAKPLVLGAIGERVESKDAKVERLDKVFEYFKCPLSGYGDVFVEEAEKNNIPYWVTAAIAFQESSCAKNTPKTEDKQESFNAWGWAVYGEQVHAFDTWEQGIAVVSKYLNQRFYSKGVTDLCEIMGTYTPPSNGSWCNGVSYFRDMILEYESP
jgi:hypothetical protein